MSNYGRPPPRIDGMVSLKVSTMAAFFFSARLLCLKKLFFIFLQISKVDNLTYRTTPEDLRRVFERCGEVGDIYIPRDRFSRESRGFAFVR